MNKKLIWAIVSGVLVIALLVTGIIWWNTSSNYVAKVGDSKLTKAEYNFYFNTYKNSMSQFAGTTADEQKKFWETKTDGKTMEEKAKETAMDEAVAFKIQLQRASDAGVKLTSDELKNIDSSIDQQISQLGRNEAEKQLQQVYNISLSEYKDLFRKLSLVRKYAEQEQGKITVSDDDVKKHYEDNKVTYNSVDVAHILFMTVDANDRTKKLDDTAIKEKEKKANDTLARVKGGEDFVKLAKELSEDPGSKDNGGQYTITKNGQMVPEFENWAFSAKVGDTGVIKSDFGYHVMKLNKVSTFDEVKDKVKADLLGKKYSEKIEGWKKEDSNKVSVNEKVYAGFKAVQ